MMYTVLSDIIPSMTLTRKEVTRRYYLRHTDRVLARTKKWASTHKDRILELARTPKAKQTRREYYKNNREARLKYRKLWLKSEAGEKYKKRVRENLRTKDIKRLHAYWAVKDAIEKGNLTRQSCFVCKKKETDAHHEDYDKPLEVVWLCRQCHADRHRTKKGSE